MSNDNVIQFNGATPVDIPVEQVISEVAKLDIKRVIVLAVDGDNQFCHFFSSANHAVNNLMLDLGKRAVLDAVTDDED